MKIVSLRPPHSRDNVGIPLSGNNTIYNKRFGFRMYADLTNYVHVVVRNIE